MDDPDFDASFWFTSEWCDERHYLLEANPFTFPGRMRGWCPAQRQSFNVSKNEMVRSCYELLGVASVQ
jgi:hypothetical protein